MPVFITHTRGDWPEGAVVIDWSASGRRVDSDVERQIEIAWSAAKARLGDRLFDGSMCRLERWDASPARLRLTVSRTGYKAFVGTNMTSSELPADVLASPVGVSSALQSSDGWLLLGQRNAWVASHPNRVHPFAGALEPAEGLNVFDEVRRELCEELGFSFDDVAMIRCLGLIENLALRQPELVFHVTSPRTRAEIEAKLDCAEHDGTWAIRATRADVASALTDPALTPVAVGTLSLWMESPLAPR
ncbi:MAG: hypothetical protein ABIP55_17405 [Tepidisphaeraceae bacterium]